MRPFASHFRRIEISLSAYRSLYQPWNVIYRSPRTVQITLSRVTSGARAMSKRAANEFLVSARSAFEHSRTRELLVGVNLIHVQADPPAGYPPWSSPSPMPYVAQTARPTAHNTLFISFQPLSPLALTLARRSGGLRKELYPRSSISAAAVMRTRRSLK